MFGGQQEHGIRPGTIPVALVAGLGKACEIAESEYLVQKETNQHIKAMLLELLSQSGLEYAINGAQEHCVSTTLNLSIKGVSSEALSCLRSSFAACQTALPAILILTNRATCLLRWVSQLIRSKVPFELVGGTK